MRWEDSVLAMLDDLEMQADGLHLAERAAEVDALSVAGYAEVELVARLHGSIGADLRVGLADGRDVRGRLIAVGLDWFLLQDAPGTQWALHRPAVALVAGLGSRSVPADARPLSARLTLRSVLRRLGDDGLTCALHLVGGRVLHGVPERVGADFVELRPAEAATPVAVPVDSVAVVQGAG